MTIKVGDKVPSVTLQQMQEDGVTNLNSEDLFKGKIVVLFALPGAFTPTCSASHVPGYVVKSDEIFAKGVDSIVCLSVNDAFVMDAWGKDQNVEDRIQMIADGSAEFTRAVGLEIDLTKPGMGIRSRRYAMIVNDGVVETLNVEEPGKFEVSDADTILSAL
ncbi:MAG: peroxiredoxin, partial [Gammaproteobacteria bacterium]|nr:peroxiredoxin [Gammaproteobacteria bacterium]